MRPQDTAQTLIDHAGLSRWGASLAMGRKGPYIDALIRRGSVPRLDVAAEIANACGCDLVAVDRQTGERVAVIDPARRDQPSDEPSTD